MSDKLFEYAIIHHPKTKEKDTPKRSALLKGVTTVLAKDEKEVGIIAAREIPEGFLDQLDCIQIAVRPF